MKRLFNTRIILHNPILMGLCLVVIGILLFRDFDFSNIFYETCDSGSCFTLVTGTGRAGTTALMILLTELKLPTGFSVKDSRLINGKASRAGLETCTGVDSIECFRSGNFSGTKIFKSITAAKFPVELSRAHDVFGSVIVLVRDSVINASASRAVQHSKGEIEGAFWDGVKNREEMIIKNSSLLANLLSALEDSNMSHIYLSYPKYAYDVKYAYEKLFGDFGILHSYSIDFREFLKVHKRVMKIQSGLVPPPYPP